MKAKHADLPWDVIFSGELLGSYKPCVRFLTCPLATHSDGIKFRNPKVYLGALQHLSLPPEKCALVAAHVADLRAAASQGIKTIYIRRPTEDNEVRDKVLSKAEGGEFDAVVDSFFELDLLLRAR